MAATMKTLRTYGNYAWTYIIDYHESAKTIEKAQIGKYYTIVSDNIDYYVVERAAKPFFSTVADQLRKHPFLYGIGVVALLIFAAHANSKPTPSPVVDPETGGRPSPDRLPRTTSAPDLMSTSKTGSPLRGNPAPIVPDKPGIETNVQKDNSAPVVPDTPEK
jgi:hypothetical protein